MAKAKVVKITAKTPCIYTLKIELAPKWIKPLIWRRLEVDGRVSLAKLHHFIQAAFGWNDAHLHEFTIDRRRFGILDPEFAADNVEDERRFSLNQILSMGDKFSYVYDFGDNWEHHIKVELVEIGEEYDYDGGALILDGARACPPEDVGGSMGYQDFLETLLTEPDSEEAANLLQWVGGEFDAELFDKRAANAAIVRMMYNRWGGK